MVCQLLEIPPLVVLVALVVVHFAALQLEQGVVAFVGLPVDSLGALEPEIQDQVVWAVRPKALVFHERVTSKRPQIACKYVHISLLLKNCPQFPLLSSYSCKSPVSASTRRPEIVFAFLSMALQPKITLKIKYMYKFIFVDQLPVTWFD